MATTTSEHSLKLLAKVIISKLENAKHIEFNPGQRNDVRDALFRKMNENILTEQALSQMVRDEISSKSQDINDSNITETDAYKMRKKALKSQYEDNMIAGFYLKKTLRDVTAHLSGFFMKSPLIEEVFADDDVLKKIIQETISTFDESKVV